jgi:hypothetical protein
MRIRQRKPFALRPAARHSPVELWPSLFFGVACLPVDDSSRQPMLRNHRSDALATELFPSSATPPSAA